MPSVKSLYVDCQILQTISLHRGMGKYSLAFLENLVTQKHNYESIILVFNSNMPLEKNILDDILKRCKYPEYIFQKLACVEPGSNSTKDAIQQNRKILTEMVSGHSSTTENDYFILALFTDDACPAFPKNTNNYLLMYDLIPYLYYKRYQQRINYKDYLARFKVIFDADIIFTISQTVADDCALHLGIPDNKLVNIDGAFIGAVNVKPKRPSKISISKKYILMPSGDELRKNNTNAVIAFEAFNSINNNEYQLIITSFFSDYSIKELSSLSENVLFSGNVPIEELLWLYKNSELIMFASEYEGLGLPILEAVSHDKKIACSDISVFREISKDAFYHFDPLNQDSIVETLTTAVENDSWDDRRNKYKDIVKKYTWDRTTRVFIQAVKAYKNHRKTDKPYVAILGPSPDGFSAIGKVMQESHSSFSELFYIDYYFEAGLSHHEMRPQFLSNVSNCYDVSHFNAKTYKEYDFVIYHIGNGQYHMQTIMNALYLPGFVILHDTNLQFAFQDMEKEKIISHQRLLLEERINTKIEVSSSSYLASLVSRQLGIYTHSKYAKSAIKEIDNNITVEAIDLPVSTPAINPHYDNKSGKIKIGLAGILANVKGLEIIEKIAVMPEFDDCEIKIFGLVTPDIYGRLEHHPNITLIANPTDYEFQTHIASLDILVNYRLEYKGETSLTVLEAMRYGAAVAVRNIGWYSELPDDAVIKVENINELLSKLVNYVSDRQLLRQIGINAKSYTERFNSHSTYVRKILDLWNTSKDKSSTSYEISRLFKSGASKNDIKEFLLSLQKSK